MAENDERIEVHDMRMPGWLGIAIGLLAVLGIAGVALGWYDASQLQAMQQSVGTQLKADQQNVAQQLSAIEQRESQTESTDTGLTSDLGVVTKKLSVTQSELQKARKEAADAADQIRTDNDQKIADLNNNVSSQLATKASADDLNATNGNVTGVKTDLEGTKNDLKMARSEIGTLIARNHDEIDQLRRMGERDYVEFTITGRNQPQKVGDVSVALRGVNVAKNQYTVALTVNDVRTIKTNRTVDEPIVFYTNGDHRADELVVNSVGKDKISGYVSIPKPTSASATSASNAGN